ncbi:SIS domain-containing protein [Chloroflexota bacterium]
MQLIQKYIDGLSHCLKELIEQDIEEIANTITVASRDTKQVFIMGNGGSATTASHFAQGLKTGAAVARNPRIRATSLTDNIAIITAIANDKDYASIFKEQLVDQLERGDIVIGISASGNSPNVLKAIEFANSEGAITIGLIGFGGGRLKDIAAKSIILSSRDYGQVEDAHLCLAHIISYLVREKIADGK